MSRAENFTDFAESVLTLGGGTLAANALSFTVLSGAVFPGGDFFVAIDTEVLYVTSRSGNTLTIASTADRGLDGTTAAAHNDGAVVYAGVLAHHLQDEYAHINGTTNVHGIADTSELFSVSVVAESANYTARNHDVVLANAATGNITVTLAAATANAVIYVKKVDTSANSVTVQVASGHLDGATSMVLTIPYESYQYVSNGTDWFIF